MTEAHDIWTIKAALDWTAGYLERKGDENPRLSAEWLLSEATGLRRIELYVNFEQPLSLDERAVLRDYVARRGAGEPLQYITGEVGFRHIAVKVRPGVLIPRPETEVLVSEALRSVGLRPTERADAAAGQMHSPDSASLTFSGEPARQKDSVQPGFAGGNTANEPAGSEKKGILVADICTGSGCVACSIAHERPDARVIATDIAPEAVALARENADALGLSARVSVLECDLGEGINPELMGAFDLVVSNPPYVPTAVLAGIPREVADFEPRLALDGGADGLDVFRRLLAFCARALKPGGAFAFELHETCLDAAAAEARSAGFSDIRIVEDLARRPRILTARAAAYDMLA